MKKLFKALGWTLAGIAVFYLAAYLILGALASKAERAADAQWKAAGQPSLDELEKRWPGAEDNPAALELEKLAAALGIPLAPSGLKRNLPPPESKTALAAALEWPGADGKPVTLTDWLNGALSNPPGDAGAFPAPLAGWLDANKSGMDGVVAQLGASEPAWGYRLSYDSPLIDLTGVNSLHRLLLARALRELHAGDAAGAERSLSAAWRLGDALGRNPILIYAILQAGMRRSELALLRALPAPGAEWIARVDAERAADRRGELRSVEGRLLSLHTRRMKDHSVGDLFGKGDAPANFLLRPLAIPYLRYAGAEASRIMGRAAEAEAHPAAVKQSPDEGDPSREGSWLVRPILSMAVPNYAKAFKKIDRARFEAELTGHVLALRAARNAAGKWPAALTDGASKVVAGESWSWTPDASGSGTLAFSKPPEWGDEQDKGMRIEPIWRPAN